MCAPRGDLMKRGVPPTPRNARTGEFTPPGISSIAFANSSSDRIVVRITNHPQITQSLHNLWMALESGYRFLWFDGDRLEAQETHEAGRGAFWFCKEFSWRVMDDDLGVFAGLAELTCELGGFDDCAVRDLFARRVADDDV